MFKLPTCEEIKAIKEQQIKSNTTGTLTATLDLQPKNFIADTTSYREAPEAPGVFAISGDMSSDSYLYALSFSIPNKGDQALFRITSDLADRDTAHAYYLRGVEMMFYFGRSGVINYQKYNNGTRIKGGFDFVCILGKRFQGIFDCAIFQHL